MTTSIAEAEQDAPADRRACTVAIVLITLLGFVLRLFLSNGPAGTDDDRYIRAAALIAHGQPIVVLDHATSRLIFLALIGVPAVWAGSLFIAALINILLALATQCLATVFAYRQVGPRAGVVVAIILALDGLSLTYSGPLFPDNLLALFMLTCAILIYRALAIDPARAMTLFFAAGVAAGLAYSAKDTGILLIVPVMAVLALERNLPLLRRASLGISFMVAFIAVWVADSLFYLFRAGDFLYKSHAIGSSHNILMEPASGFIDFLRRGWWNLALTADSVWLNLIPLLVGSVAWVVIILRRDRMMIFALCGAFVSAYLFFGSSSFARFVNLPYQERYLTPVVPFVAISLVEAFRQLRVRLTTPLIATLLAACLVFGTYGAARRSSTLYFTDALRNAAIAVKVLPSDGLPVYAQERVWASLLLYVSPDIAARLRNASSVPREQRTGYYVVALENGLPVFPDSSIVASDLGALYVNIGLSNRPLDRWYLTPAAPSRYTASVYQLVRH